MGWMRCQSSHEGASDASCHAEHADDGRSRNSEGIGARRRRFYDEADVHFQDSNWKAGRSLNFKLKASCKQQCYGKAQDAEPHAKVKKLTENGAV